MELHGSSYHGCFYERFISLTLTCLRRTLGWSYVTIKTIQTIINEIKAIVNDRPLTFVSSNIADEEPMTPSLVLYGWKITTTTYQQTDVQDTVNICSGKYDILQCAQLQKNILDNLWKRWKRISHVITRIPSVYRKQIDSNQHW